MASMLRRWVGGRLVLMLFEGTLTFLGDEREFFSRTPATEDLRPQHYGMGRELFERVPVVSRGFEIETELTLQTLRRESGPRIHSYVASEKRVRHPKKHPRQAAHPPGE